MTTIQILNKSQLETLVSIADTFIASLDEVEIDDLVRTSNRVQSKVTPASDVIEYGHASWSSMNLVDKLVDKLPKIVPPDKIPDLTLGLNLLSSRAGTFALTGHFSEFKKLPRKQREAIVRGWSTSSLMLMRMMYKSFLSLCINIAYAHMENPLHKSIAYPCQDPDVFSDRFTSKEFPKYDFIKVPEGGLTIETDVVIIGSGAGGGVAAAELAKAGKRVIVLEKGKYYHQSEILGYDEDGGKMYEKGSAIVTDDSGFIVFAGSTFGGGTTVNWCASLRPQHFVRKEWAEEYGLPKILSPVFNDYIERVCTRIGASTEAVSHNSPNSIIIEGCKKLGYHYDTIPQNTAGNRHDCGFCGMGCRYGEKQGSLMTWLADARDNGAQFVQECFVDRVIIKKGVATGVEARVGPSNARLTIRAPQVVCAAGSLHTPGLLIRSGLKNSNIGKHLRMHPCTIVYGVFPDRDVTCYRGAIMTALSNVVENVDGRYYGAKLEIPTLHPANAGAVLPWRNALQHKKLMLDYNHVCPVLILTRDYDSKGSVEYYKDGSVKMLYALSEHDRRSMMEGMLAALKILVAAGASEVSTVQNSMDSLIIPPVERGSIGTPRFNDYVARVRHAGLATNSCGFFNAHQMGSCRMGSSPRLSAVRPDGQTWEVKNLYVADASLFPTASGVNPMVTTMSMSMLVANEMINRDKNKKNSNHDVQARL